MSKPEDKLHLDLPSPSPNRPTTRATPELMPSLDLNTLFKFIKPYDGSRETLNSFIVNCNNAYDLAQSTQKNILFKYIVSQLQGKAEIACSIKEFSSWDQLKDFLKTQFSERKHYAHLLTELQECRQGPNDNVSQFALKVETHLSQLLVEISSGSTLKKDLPGRTAAMEDLALHHFLMGLHPRISNIVRCRSPRTLNEAINLAVSEERIQQTLYRRTQTDQKPNNRYNNNNNRAGPSRQSTNAPNYAQKAPSTQYHQQGSSVFCRYCKTPGHDISACRKREFNNNRFRQNPNNNQPARVNFIEPEEENYEDPQEDNQSNLNE